MPSTSKTRGAVPLTSRERALLSVLDEEGGFTTARIAQITADSVLQGWPPRSRSQFIRHNLNHMLWCGLVAHLDEAKPVCWVRLKLGTRALKAENGLVRGEGA